MSSSDELSSDEEQDFEDDEEYSSDDESKFSEEEELSAEDRRLLDAAATDDAAAVQEALQDGANMQAEYSNTTPWFVASYCGYDQIIRIFLDAGADPRWRNSRDESALTQACVYGFFSIVQLLINHDSGLLESSRNMPMPPLYCAIATKRVETVRFLLDRGADPHHVDRFGNTALMIACQRDSLEIVRLLLAAGVDVEARNMWQKTALHYAAADSDAIEAVRALILQHNANMFAVNEDGHTPFDLANKNGAVVNPLLEMYADKLTEDYFLLALHELLTVAEYSFAEKRSFHPPLNPLRIILPLGKLRLKHFRTLLHTLDHDLIGIRDDAELLPIHTACQTNAPVEILALILELDPTALHIADSTGALPIHLLCGSTAATEHASVRFLVEQGGVGTLAARDRRGLLPLHVLCESTNPPLRVVQYLIQSFPGSVAMQTNAGLYPFTMAAAAESSSTSLSVIYELVRANPGLVVSK